MQKATMDETDLLCRVARVSVETMHIIDRMADCISPESRRHA